MYIMPRWIFDYKKGYWIIDYAYPKTILSNSTRDCAKDLIYTVSNTTYQIMKW